MTNEQIDAIRDLKVEYKKTTIASNNMRLKYHKARKDCDHKWPFGDLAFVAMKYHFECLICGGKASKINCQRN